MRCWILAAVALVSCGVNARPAAASPTDAVCLVDSWYLRYLGRPADLRGAQIWVRELRVLPVDVVEANFLASAEYYHRNGCNPIGYVRALYRDVLGDLYPSDLAVSGWVTRLSRDGSRTSVALGFLRAARAPVVVAPVTLVEPVRVVQSVPVSPVLVPNTVFVPARVPLYRPLPRTGFSLRIGF